MRVPCFKLIAFVFFLALGGCASAPQNQAPFSARQAGGDIALARAAALDQTDHMSKHLDEAKQVLYFQNFGGGGAAVGVLLGPVGVAANIKAIDSNTSKDVDVLRNKTDADPILAFKSAAGHSGRVLHEQPNGTASRATPYVYVVKTQQDPDVLAIAAALLVESPSDKAANERTRRPNPSGGSSTCISCPASTRRHR